MMENFDILPEVIFYIIKDYVCLVDYQRFLNTSKWDFLYELKRKSGSLFLNSNFSKKYLLNEEFSLQVKSKVDDAKSQIGLHISSSLDFPIMRMINTKALVFENVDITELGVKDLSILNSIEMLTFSYHTRGILLTSFHDFHSLKELTFCEIPDLNDVSTLENLPNLQSVTIDSCFGLRDINPLRNVSNISISYCGGVNDEGIRQLGVKNISIYFNYLHGITSINHIKSVKNAILQDCRSIESIENLSNLHSLEIIDCQAFTKFENVSKLKHFQIKGSAQFDPSLMINTIHKLRSFGYTSLFHSLFTGFPATILTTQQQQQTSRLTVFHLENISAPMNLNQLSNSKLLSKLILKGLSQLEISIELFQNVKELIIANCPFPGIQQSMKSLQILSIANCRRFTNLNGLSCNRNMILSIQSSIEYEIPCVTLRYAMKLSFGKRMPTVTQFDWNVIHSKTKENNYGKNMIVCCRDIPSKQLNNIRFLFPFISQLHLQRIAGLSNLSSFPGIESVPILSIHSCSLLYFLHDDSLAANVNHCQVILRDCKNITNIRCLSKVRLVTIIDCPEITDLRPLHDCSYVEYCESRGGGVVHPLWKPDGLDGLISKKKIELIEDNRGMVESLFDIAGLKE